MTTELARNSALDIVERVDAEEAASALEHILSTGDLSKLSGPQRVHHFLYLCQSLGLNPASRPLDWIEFYDPETKGKKLTLYLNQSGAAQLRRIHRISTRFTRREPAGELFVVEAEGTTPDGRTATATKYVATVGPDGKRLAGSRLGNALMKCETGALRRLTLAMVGLTSGPDPDEHSCRTVVVDAAGNILRHPTAEQRALASDPRLARAIHEPTYEDMAGASPLAGSPSQAPTADELEPVRPPRPRAKLRPDEDDIKRLLGAWFAAVRGTSLDDDDARHDMVASWTLGLAWPKGKLTQSLREFFARATEQEAGDFLQHARAIVESEKAAAEALAEARQEGRLEEVDDPIDGVLPAEPELFDPDDPTLQRRPDGGRYPR